MCKQDTFCTIRGYNAPSNVQFVMVLHIDKKSQALNLAFFVPPLGIEPGPSEPESEILSFKLQGQFGIAKIVIILEDFIFRQDFRIFGNYYNIIVKI